MARRNSGALGDDAGGELLGRHFQREEADDAAVDGGDMAVGPRLAAMRLGDVVGDVGGERGLAHAGAAGDDDQVGRLQAAHLGVEVLQAGGEAGQLAVALIGAGRHVDRGGQRLGEALEARAEAARLGDLVELALGVLDLLARREIDRRVERHIDHVLADADQVSPHREVGDGAAVVGGVDDGGGFGGEAGEILAGVEPADVHVGRQEGLQRDRRGDLAGADQVRGQLIELLMDRLEEMLRLEKIGDPVERLVVDDDGAEQRLLRLDVLRGVAVLRRGRFRQLADGRIERCHEERSEVPGVSELGAVALNVFLVLTRTRRSHHYMLALSASFSDDGAFASARHEWLSTGGARAGAKRALLSPLHTLLNVNRWRQCPA